MDRRAGEDRNYEGRNGERMRGTEKTKDDRRRVRREGGAIAGWEWERER